MKTILTSPQSRTQSVPASILSMKLYGTPRSVVLHTLTSHLTISNANYAAFLQDYYLLYCTSEHFSTNHHAGCYYRDNKEYVIVYVGCTRWDAVHHSHQISLSFRSAKPEYNLPAYVLVTLIEPTKRRSPSRFSSSDLVESDVCND